MSGIQPFPLARKGDDGRPVFTLQWLLRERGELVTVDGDFGPKTDAAVRSVQGSLGLTVDGIVGPKTWSAILVQVKRGSKGDAVRGVQQEFRDREGQHPPQLALDGDFGPKTEAAVRGFQQALRADDPSVAVDGIVGPVTWRALISGMLLL